MKEMFKGYIHYNSEEYNRIWNDSIIVVDTNILLNLFRYSKSTRNEILKIFKDLESRLWIPYQVGLEFFNNKDKVIAGLADDYDKLINSINKEKSNTFNEISSFKESRLNSKDKLLKQLESNHQKLVEIITKEKDEKVKSIKSDKVEDKIINLFDDKIGDCLSEEEMEKVLLEGQRRFNEKVPPGYKDSQKESNGDYIIFYDFMKKAQAEHKDIIFVTDDVKEDWFEIIRGRKNGRKELLDEFYKTTKQLLLIFTAEDFIKYYNKKNNVELDNKIIEEIELHHIINYDVNELSYLKKIQFLNQIKEALNINILSYEEAENYYQQLSEFIKNDIPIYYQDKVLKYQAFIKEDLKNEERNSFIADAFQLINLLIELINVKPSNQEIDNLIYQHKEIIKKIRTAQSKKTILTIHKKLEYLKSNYLKLFNNSYENCDFYKVHKLLDNLLNSQKNRNLLEEKIIKELNKNLKVLNNVNNDYFGIWEVL